MVVTAFEMIQDGHDSGALYGYYTLFEYFLSIKICICVICGNKNHFFNYTIRGIFTLRDNLIGPYLVC